MLRDMRGYVPLTLGYHDGMEEDELLRTEPGVRYECVTLEFKAWPTWKPIVGIQNEARDERSMWEQLNLERGWIEGDELE
jgi:hypothetical protein